jgi:hypothetical protein
MDPKWVLTNEEKRVRFKNYFKKKDELAASSASSAESGGPMKMRRYRGQRPGQAAASAKSKSAAASRLTLASIVIFLGVGGWVGRQAWSLFFSLSKLHNNIEN